MKMIFLKIRLVLILLASVVFYSCIQKQKTQIAEPEDYWTDGRAEVSSYHLSQARYGEIREGDAVLIFVPEDFSKSKHVKLDNPSKAGDDKIRVLKMNNVRKFNTGIYDYSLMASVFTPIDLGAKSLKATCSTQEWCGQCFNQLNAKGSGYEGVQYSYFESEGDQSINIGNYRLEDEIWNIIKIDPDFLPKGEIELVPSLYYARLRHKEIKEQPVRATLIDNGGTNTYNLTYKNIDREVKITFDENSPYTIREWEETTYSGFKNKIKLTTKAVLNKSKKIKYWEQNSLADSTFRKEIGL